MNQTRSHSLKNRLQFRVCTILFTIVVLAMSVFSMLGAVSVRTELHNHLEDMLHSSGERIAEGIADSMWNMDADASSRLLLSELNDTHIQGLIVRDVDQEVVSGKLRTAQNTIVDTSVIQDQTGLRSAEFAIEYDDEELGKLELYVTEEHMQHTLESYYLSELIQAILLSTVLVVFMYFALRQILIKPLTNLTASANALSQGEVDITISTNAVGEVGDLARALEVFKQQSIEKTRLEEEQEKERLVRKEQDERDQRAENERRDAEQQIQKDQLEASKRENIQSQALQKRADLLLEAVDAVANGDLSRDITLSGDDVVGRIALRIAQLVSRLRTSLTGINTSANRLSTASKTLADSSQNISSNTENTSIQVATVSASAEQISDDVKMVATAVNQMSETVHGIATNTDEATMVATKASLITNDTNAMVQQLADSSSGIGDVIKTITSIAEQTNLLALNATIEAARAGEAGKGFAVVANEVKELAKETAKATEEISQRINAIQNDSHSVTESISSISDIIGQINELQKTVASAVSEQSTANQEISRTVTETAKGSSDISDNISEVAKAAEKTSLDARQAQSTSNELEQMADELRAMVGTFKLGDETVTNPGSS